ncbi:MAG TPA: PASTA domain-containing protein, partial [Candidatus Ruania gallistercoris]|nr:PASTA domain-containing protein [Candidatus Ruania gallistercoris]
PDLTGMTQDQARATLLETVPEGGTEGLELVVGDPVADPEVPEGEAVSWSPETETMVDEGTSVEVAFSSGPGELEIPDVSGMSQDQARQRLESEGFNPASFSVATEDVPNVQQDDVIRTEPEAGTMAHPDDPIEIVIATGNVELPDLVDRDLEEARNILNDLGLSSSITEQEDEGDPGRVLNQSPGASTVPNDTTVELVVSIPVPEPEPTETPSDEPTDDANADAESDGGGDNSGGGDNNGGGDDSSGGGDNGGDDSNGNADGGNNGGGPDAP